MGLEVFVTSPGFVGVLHSHLVLIQIEHVLVETRNEFLQHDVNRLKQTNIKHKHDPGLSKRTMTSFARTTSVTIFSR